MANERLRARACCRMGTPVDSSTVKPVAKPSTGGESRQPKRRGEGGDAWTERQSSAARSSAAFTPQRSRGAPREHVRRGGG